MSALPASRLACAAFLCATVIALSTGCPPLDKNAGRSGKVASLSGPWRGGLAQRQHQPVRPGEERGGGDHVDDRRIVEPDLAQPLHMPVSERYRCPTMRHRRGAD